MEVVIGTVGCTLVHGIGTLFPFRTKDGANLMTCVVFQLFFLANCIRLLGMPPNEEASQGTLTNLDYLYGYFIYDFVYLFRINPKNIFILHHMVSMIIIHLIHYIGVPFHTIYNYTMICLLLECANPLLNARHFLVNTNVYPLFMKITYYVFVLSRMILLPVYVKFLTDVMYAPPIWYCFGAVYAMSAFWTYSMRKLIQ